LPGYLIEKNKRELKTEALEKQQQELIALKIKHDNYIADCMWAMATDMRFTQGKKNPKPTLARWYELLIEENIEKVKKESNKCSDKTKLTKEVLKAQFIRLKGGK